MEVGKLSEYLKAAFDKYKYVFILCLCGLALVCISDGDTSPAMPYDDERFSSSVSSMESRLGDALERIAGVGKVSVVLTAKSSSQSIYAYDEDQTVQSSEEMETSDTTRSMVFSGSASDQRPICIQTLEPEYRGALVVCQGGHSSAVRLEVTRVVAALTGLGSNDIVVSKMK